MKKYTYLLLSFCCAGMTGSSILAMEKGSTNEEKEQSFPVITCADGMWHISRKTTLGQADESPIIYVTDQLYSAKNEDVAKGCALLRNLNLVPAEDADATILVDLAKEWSSSENARVHRCPFAWKVGHAFCNRELEQSKYPVILEYLIKNKADVTVSAICRHKVGGKRIDEILTNNIFPVAMLYYELDSESRKFFSDMRKKMSEKKFSNVRIGIAVKLLLGDLTIENFADEMIKSPLVSYHLEALKFIKQCDSSNAVVGRFRGYIIERMNGNCAEDKKLSPEARIKAFTILNELYTHRKDYYSENRFNPHFVFDLINNVLRFVADEKKIQPFPIMGELFKEEDKKFLNDWYPEWSVLSKIYTAARWQRDNNARVALNHIAPLFNGEKELGNLWAHNVTRYEAIEEAVSRQGNPYSIRAHDMLRYYRSSVIATTGILAAVAAVRFYSPLHASLGNLVNQGYRRVIAGVWNESGLVGSRVV